MTGSAKSSSSVSQSSSSAVAAPCPCPTGLASSYTLTIQAGSYTAAGGVSITWVTQTFTVNGTPCNWIASTPFQYTSGGVLQNGGTPIVALDNDDTPCRWRVTQSNPYIANYEKFTDLTPVGGYTPLIPTGGTLTGGAVSVA